MHIKAKFRFILSMSITCVVFLYYTIVKNQQGKLRIEAQKRVYSFHMLPVSVTCIPGHITMENIFVSW
jgi:hypothetical protein